MQIICISLQTDNHASTLHFLQAGCSAQSTASMRWRQDDVHLLVCQHQLQAMHLRYVLPVFWMTSYFHIVAHMMHGVGNNDVGGAVLRQVVKISNLFTRRRHALFEFLVVYKWRTFFAVENFESVLCVCRIWNNCCAVRKLLVYSQRSNLNDARKIWLLCGIDVSRNTCSARQ